jgi:putative addiction module killer protein
LDRALKMLVLPGGRCPFEEWYGALRDPVARVDVRRRLARVRAGNLGDARQVGRGVSELRIDTGPGYRVYFAVVGDAMLLLCAGDKSSQQRDIEAARAMLEAHDGNEGLQRDV